MLNPISLTRKLLAFETVNPPGNERDCARYLGGLLESAGYAVDYFEFAERRTTLVARLGASDEKPPICFTGHLDTVGLGESRWSRDPFCGETDGDRLYGRGASDMKSGVAAITAMALDCAKAKQRKAGLTVILTAGEETTCQGADHLAKQPNALGQAGALVVGEPTGNMPWIAHKGCVRIVIRTKGVAAHSSMPHQGENAIYKAAAAIMKLRRFDFDVAPHPILGAPTLSVGTISGGSAINVVPDQATIGIDLRTLPNQDEEALVRQLHTLLGNDVGIERLQAARSISTPADHEWVGEVLEIMENLLGTRPEPGGAAYFTDASVLTPAYGHPPTLILGPGEPEMAHKNDEYCYVSKIQTAAEAYAEIARRWCGL